MLALLPAAAHAQGTTYFVEPSGSGDACSEEAPCEIAKAVAKALDGDSIRLLPSASPYQLPFPGLTIEREIDLGGIPGAAPVIKTTSVSTIQVQESANASLHDLRLVGGGRLELESGSAERVAVAYAGQKKEPVPTAACELGPGTILRDSLCWANEAGEETAANGVESLVATESVNTTVSLRNVTAEATDAAGHGLLAEATYGAKLRVDGLAVIARAANGADVSATIFGASGPEVAVALAHSNYATIEQKLPRATATAPGAEDNQSAAPLFAGAAEGNFRELPGSPTVDAGLTDPLSGPLDLDGYPRSLPGCLGASPVPDIGAYELAGTGACPPPPPPTEEAPGPEAPKPAFRIIKVALHGSRGSLQIETPAAGMVTLTGVGVRLITRQTAGPQIVTLPIKPWAITLVRIKRSGRTKLRLKVRFASPGAPLREKSRAVVLKTS